MRYFGSVYRPPSEARSLIVQVTYGCSHNTCAFCSMYKAKKFTLRPMEEILEDFRLARQAYSKVGRIFLADGDALIRPAADLERILEVIAELFPECERVTCYASPSSIHKRTPEELKRLRERNLTMVYMGLESGCDEVLKRMRKGHTAADIVAAGQKINAAIFTSLNERFSHFFGVTWKGCFIVFHREKHILNAQYVQRFFV